MSKKVVRFSVIGVGNMGSGHANRVLKGEIPGLELVAVCDVNPEKTKSFEDKGVKAFTDARALISSGEVDAVLIATPALRPHHPGDRGA
jgi:predicted dehydrogenase